MVHGCFAFTALVIVATTTVFRGSSLVCAYPDEDVVDHLPGFDGPLPSKWYSGYLNYHLPAVDNRLVHTHYIYVEKADEKANNDHVTLENDQTSTSSHRRVNQESSKDIGDETPLIFWSNGGPGASSLFGLLTELGPFSLNDNSLQTESYNQTGVPTLFENPYSWNRLGSLLIFDAPAPVGYSYCDDKSSGDGLSCGGWDDESSTLNNYYALLAFYDKFPELKSRPLYLTGESYAGIYIPSLARIVLENKSSSSDRREHTMDPVATNDIPLKGFAVGDGCVGTEINCGSEGPLFNILFMAGHGQISMKTYMKLMHSCTEDELIVPGHDKSQECTEILEAATKEVGGFYEYSLYDDCIYRNDLFRKKQSAESNRGLRGGIADVAAVTGALNDYACGGGIALGEYVLQDAVKKAMHVPPDSFFFIGDNGVGFNYTPTEANLMSFYHDVAKGKKYDNVKVLVYNGDVDPAINSLLAQNWTSHLGLEETEAWRPWTLDSCRRMGGYVTRYEGSFDFLTIRGAGHMVPTYKPESSFAFLSAWIHDEPYPYYDPTCTHP